MLTTNVAQDMSKPDIRRFMRAAVRKRNNVVWAGMAQLDSPAAKMADTAVKFIDDGHIDGRNEGISTSCTVPMAVLTRHVGVQGHKPSALCTAFVRMLRDVVTFIVGIPFRMRTAIFTRPRISVFTVFDAICPRGEHPLLPMTLVARTIRSSYSFAPPISPLGIFHEIRSVGISCGTVAAQSRIVNTRLTRWQFLAAVITGHTRLWLGIKRTGLLPAAIVHVAPAAHSGHGFAASHSASGQGCSTLRGHWQSPLSMSRRGMFAHRRGTSMPILAGSFVYASA